MNMRILIFVTTVVTATAFFSCKKDVRHEIPNVYVNLYIDPNSTMYFQLNTVGGWLHLTGGYRGITVYRASVDEFVCFERTCPHDADQESAYVDVDQNGLTLTCKTCSSQFLILDGSVVTGPATIPLKKYNNTYDGLVLHIYN